MAGMFDYFSNRAAMMAPPAGAPETEEERRRKLLALTRRVATGEPITTEPATVGATVESPRLMPMPRPEPGQEYMYQARPDQVGTYTPDTETKLQRAQERTQYLMDLEGNPVVNNDRGWKGRLLDIVRQSVISAGDQYNRTGDLGAALGGGIAGAFGGGFRPTMDEERQRLQDIKRSQYNEAMYAGQLEQEAAQNYKNAQVRQAEMKPIVDMTNAETDRMKVLSEGQKVAAEDVRKNFELLPDGADLTDPQYADLVLKAKAANVVLPRKKEAGVKYFGSFGPDGRYVVLNQATGKADVAFEGQSFQKPPTMDDSDFNDDMFRDIGLLSDSEIAAKAAAAVGPDTQGALKLSDEAVRYFGNLPDYKNPDGTINEGKIAQDASIGLLQMPNGVRLYENEATARAAQQKINREKDRLSRGQAQIKAEVGRLRLALKGLPKADALEALDLYKEAKRRNNTKALAELKKQLGMR